eukprot:SAG11_NODE_1038_length_6076_cov_4.857454_4_plen_49_part_00
MRVRASIAANFNLSAMLRLDDLYIYTFEIHDGAFNDVEYTALSRALDF